MSNPNFESIVKYFVSGILSAYLLIFSLRPSVMNPDVILHFFEHRWLILILFLINYYIFVWDYTNGVLFLLIIIALIFDYVVFIDMQKINTPNNIQIQKSDDVIYTNTNDLDPNTFESHMINQLKSFQQKSLYDFQPNFLFF